LNLHHFYATNMTYTGITLARSNGRIFEETLSLLAAAGITPSKTPSPRANSSLAPGVPIDAVNSAGHMLAVE
jgi:ATP phosphoribosyltransferase